ncbi:tyrosine protein phosphatase yvh1 [Neopestalotiopsis sp. 37M]|nr:tyrosine protein phosphatase yvh1 [Neopestalotiopsis sp. 37M]
MALNRIPGDDDLYVGGIFALTTPEKMEEKNITSILSVIKYSFQGWGEKAKLFNHLSIDVDDMEDEDLLAHLPKAVRFIDRGLHATGSEEGNDGDNQDKKSSGAVYVHCAMGKSRSVTCVVAYLLYKHPHRYGGKQFVPSAASTAQRRQTSYEAVMGALSTVRECRSLAEPNPGFMRQLELWWEMGCPAGSDDAVENHPIYQKWLYENKLKEARDARMAPDADWIRFEDEAEPADDAAEQKTSDKQLRCKKCRRVLANSKFIVDHKGTGQQDGGSNNNNNNEKTECQHIFVETLSWMRPYLQDGALDGRLLCPNAKCNAHVGRFDWRGFNCSCKEWVCPAFSLARGRVDEVLARPADMGIRMPPGRNGSL